MFLECWVWLVCGSCVSGLGSGVAVCFFWILGDVEGGDENWT